MEIGVPTWNSSTMSYSFRILKSNISLTQRLYYEPPNVNFPATPSDSEGFLQEILEKTKKYFTTPLTVEKVLRHLRYTTDTSASPKEAGWYEFLWKPTVFIVKSGDFCLSWELDEVKPIEPVIPAEFTATTPRAQSPAPEQASLRQIQIHDSLIPVGDLPLSDLPPLSFGMEEVDPQKEENKRRIREARLKLQLAKLKAQRMEQKYYERYGQRAQESDESSDFSSDSEESEEDFPFQRSST
jgi:hypothetical protein